jgi:hypothetical protein
MSCISDAGCPATGVIIFGGVAAERNLMWGSDAVEYGAKGYKIRSLWLLVLLVLSMEVFM